MSREWPVQRLARIIRDGSPEACNSARDHLEAELGPAEAERLWNEASRIVTKAARQNKNGGAS